MVLKNDLRRVSLYDRIEKLLVSFDWSDCVFSVSGKEFKAHKLILGVSSPVFEAMFYGPLSSNDSIVITDIEHDTFQLLLNYIYTDKIVLSSIEQAFELLYASRKYLLEHLSELCLTFIQANISIDNVIYVLNYPEFMQDKSLTTFALKLFSEHANYLLQEYKTIISCPCMKAILETSDMNINEKDLIKHVFEWTIVYCKSNDISPTIEHRRNILFQNGLFKLLRVFALSSDDLEEISASDNNLFLPLESHYIKSRLQYDITILRGDKDVFCASWKPRGSLKIQWCICHRTPLKPVAPIVIDSNNYTILSRIKASKTLFINSLYIPTRMSPVLNFHSNIGKVYSENFSIYIICESDDSIIKFTNFMNTVEYDSTVDIELTEPCLIKKDKWYKISFIWPKNVVQSSSYVVECRDKEFNDHRVTFEFDDTSQATQAGGSFLGGLKYCL